MGGEQLAQAELALDGLRGDRAFAIRDEQALEVRGGKHLPKLMLCSARYPDSASAQARVQLPDGGSLDTDDPQLGPRLSEFLGRAVTVWPRLPASDHEHYRRVQPGASLAGTLARAAPLRKLVSQLATVGPGGRELRAAFGRVEGEPMPDLSVFPPELFEYVSPPGTYFDAYPVHLLTTASLRALRAKHPAGDWDPLRFRANFVIETEASLEGLVEAAWEGRTLCIGPAQLQCTVKTPRCSMVMQPQAALAKDPSVLRTIVREANQCVGIYARVLMGGLVSADAEVELH